MLWRRRKETDITELIDGMFGKIAIIMRRHRKEMEYLLNIKKLRQLMLMRDFKVMREDRLDMFEVVFHGPKNSPYEGGVWRIRVELPPEYPFEPPRLFFVNSIFHPNIHFLSGLICSDCLYWDDLDKGWSSIDDLVDIFEDCIPRLLYDPNIECPTNHDAAEMLKHDEGEYKQLVRAFCEMFTNMEGMLSENSSGDKESGSEESTSEEGSG